jgi:hypothetical protein
VEVKRVTTVTTTEAQGGMAVEAKCATAVEQRPPSFTLRHNQWRRKSSLDGGPLLWKLNDGGHGSGAALAPFQHGDDDGGSISKAYIWTRWA